MANELKSVGTPGQGTMTAVIIRSSDGYMWDQAAGEYAATPTAVNMAVTMTEVGSTGRYLGTLIDDMKLEAASMEIKIEYADIVPGSFAYGTAITERQIIYIDANGDVLLNTVSVNAATTLAQADLDVIADMAGIFRMAAAQSGGSATTIKLASGESASDDQLVGNLINVWQGVGEGQTRLCTDYVASTRIATIAPAWESGGTPVSGSKYAIIPNTNHVLRVGTAAAGAAGTITLDGLASTSQDFYNGCIVNLISGTGAGQSRIILDYALTTQIATVEPNWVINPDSTTAFEIIQGSTNIDIIKRSLPSADELYTALTYIGLILSKLPSSSANIAGEGTTIKNLDQVGSHIILSGTTASLGTNVTADLGTSGTSTVTDFYKGMLVQITAGVTVGQTRLITAYDGSTRVVTFEPAMTAAVPDATTYQVLNGTGINPDGIKLNAVQAAAWAANLVKSAGVMHAGTATGGSQTELIDTSLTAADDTYNGRIVMFLTGTLAGQVASISDYDLGTTTLTISQVTASPTTETYIII